MRRENSSHNWLTCCSSMRNLRLMIMLVHNWRMMRCSSFIMTGSNLFSFLPLRRSPRFVSKQKFVICLILQSSSLLINVKNSSSPLINFKFGMCLAFSCERLHWLTLVPSTSVLISLRSCPCFPLKSWRIWFAVRFVSGWMNPYCFLSVFSVLD